MITTPQAVVAVPQEILYAKLKRIATIVEKHYKDEKSSGGLSGLAGLATFAFEYAKFKDNDHFASLGTDILSRAIDTAFQPPALSTYCSGIAGLGWTLEHLQTQDYIEINNDELLSEIDELLYQRMMADLRNRYYDILHGGLGYFYYFIKRHESTSSLSLKKRYITYLRKGITALENIGVHDGDSIYWLSTMAPKNDEWIINTGLSHGMASILSVLASAHNIPQLQSDVQTLLDKAIQFYLIHKNPEEIISIFPTYITPNREEPRHNARLAWCYGDLGIAMCFLKLAKIPRYNYLKTEAELLLDASIAMRIQQKSGVEDAGFCHGAFGIAHSYNIAYKELGLARLKDEQHFWMKRAFEMEQPDIDYAGFPMFIGKEIGWEPRLSLLEGIAGIGLVIIDYLSGERGSWDKAFLL